MKYSGKISFEKFGEAQTKHLFSPVGTYHMKEERYCVTCANWIPTESRLPPRQATSSSNIGECHRYAPRPLVVAGETSKNATAFWPTTRATDSCGEWYYGGLKLSAQHPDEVETDDRAQSVGATSSRGPATPTG